MRFNWFFILIFPFFCEGTPFGQDADLVNIKAMVYPCNAEPLASGIGVSFARTLIHFHHDVITEIDGPRSHFRPSSSQYALDAIEKYGFIKGFLLGCDRLLRENEEEWVYPKILNEHDELYKWDPVR